MSSNVISEWRQAVQDYLAGFFPELDVRGGEIGGVSSRDQDMLVVFWPGWPERPSDPAFARPTLTMRWFPSLSNQPPTENPRDETALEQAAVDLMVAMEPMRKVGDFHPSLSCRVVSVTKHATKTAWYVEATVRANALNPAASAA